MSLKAEPLARFVSVDGSFSFSYPADWEVKSKPVRTHVDEILIKGTNKRQVAVVIDRVKLDKLETFGTFQRPTRVSIWNSDLNFESG